MNYEEKEVLLLQLLSTKCLVPVEGMLYVYKQPSLELQYEAEHFYADLEYELSFDELLTKEDAEKILIRWGLWRREYHAQMKQIEDQVENLKVKLYQSVFRSKEREKIRLTIKSYQKQLQRLHEQHTLLDYVTKEQYLKTLKLQYVIALSIFDKKDKPVYNKEELLDSDNYIISQVINYLSQAKLTHNILRELARTEPWRSHWSIGKERVFSSSVGDLTDEQRALALFSRMYDSAYNHTECPDDDVINDDDAFDGWLILQNRERKRSLVQKEVNKMMTKHKGASEIMIPVDNVEDARKISNMNSIESQIDLKTRQAALAKKGKIDEVHLPDMQRKLRQEAVQKYRDTVKKGT